ncbi:hypothetical protein SLS58_008213 [Diplodia intermedia]|uniref:Uncharacterized protein n=1 Tax=Diplodia intermedia TaxID=856260 RepID=A0ABR3THY2_9PEZI
MDPDPNGPVGDDHTSRRSDSAANPDNATDGTPDEALRMRASLRSLSSTLAQIRECHQTQNNLMESLQHQIESFRNFPVIRGNDEILRSIQNLGRELHREFNDQITRAGLIAVRNNTTAIRALFLTILEDTRTEFDARLVTETINNRARRYNAEVLSSGTDQLMPMYSYVDHEMIADFPGTGNSIETLTGPTLDSLLHHLQFVVPPEVSLKKAMLRCAIT